MVVDGLKFIGFPLDRVIRTLSNKGISTKIRYTKPIKTTDNYTIARIVRCDLIGKKSITLLVAFFPEKKR